MNANKVKVRIVQAASCVALIAALAVSTAHSAGPTIDVPIIDPGIKLAPLDPGLTTPLAPLPQFTPEPQFTPAPQFNSAPQLNSAPPTSSGPPPGGGVTPSYANLIIPAVCAGVGTNQMNNACSIVGAAGLGWALRDAMVSAKTFRDVTDLILQATGPTIIGYAFPTSANLAYKIELVKAISDNQVALFQAMQNSIQTTMIDNPQSQAARRAGAIASSYNYVQLTQQAAANARQSAIQTVNYLQGSPYTSRVRFHCSNACGQVIHIYRTGAGFD